MDRALFDELDVVATTVDLPEHGLLRGSVGTIVMTLASNAFEVDFVDRDGRTYALETLTADQLLRLSFEPSRAVS